MSSSAVSPHADANIHNLFISSYDHDFLAKASGDHAFSNKSHTSGHTSNRPVLSQLSRLSGALDTTNGTFFTKATRSVDFEQVVQSSLLPREAHTAQSKERGTVGIGRCPPTPKSTTQDTYTLRGEMAEGELAPYAGNSTVQFKRDFLYCTSLDNPTRALRKSAGGTVPTPLLAGRRGQLHTGSGNREYFLHSRLIGDRSRAHPSQLPTKLLDATNAELVRGGQDRKSVLESLGGRSPSNAPSPTASQATNPIPMTQAQKDACRVARRLENEGHVNTTTYQSYFVNQRHLPEVADPKKAKPESNIVVLPNVTATALQVTSLVDAQGRLLDSRPPGVHPSVWSRMKDNEQRLTIDKGDPHKHKLRVQ